MLRLAAALSCALLCASSCSASGGGCTEIDCNNEAVVTYPAGLVSGPYSLTLRNGSDMETFACNDPQTAAELPPEIRCNASGFELTDSPLGARSTVTVTIVDDEDNLVVGPVEVILQAVETVTPNGPDCEPTCFVRNGRLE
jgi:hypothetical protein